MDLSKLTPAPWRYVSAVRDSIVGPDDKPVVQSQMTDYDDCDLDVSQVDAEFIALARNAFEVMMRRGWFVKRSADGWTAWDDNYPVEEQWGGDNYLVHYWHDPYTALVEADEWYKANVENTK